MSSTGYVFVKAARSNKLSTSCMGFLVKSKCMQIGAERSNPIRFPVFLDVAAQNQMMDFEMNVIPDQGGH